MDEPADSATETTTSVSHDTGDQVLPVDDRVLMNAIAMRDQEALMLLYARYGATVYAMALRVLGNPSSAEEVTQDIFVKVWNQPARWNSELGRLSSWLLATTRNAAIDRLRQENRQWRALDVESAHEEVIGETSVADDPLWADGQVLRQILEKLPYQQRQLIELAFYGGHTHSELARILDLPLGTVKTRLRAAIQTLREHWIEANTKPSPAEQSVIGQPKRAALG
jgi:RNA polymerase sigma-70 factor (ECF subfamily)